MGVIESLTEHLAKLPGIGPRSAQRLTYYLLNRDKKYGEQLGKFILRLIDQVHPCPLCHAFTELELCEICSDETREIYNLCIVEQPQDIWTIESTREYHGRYYSLNGVISPIEGVGPEELGIPLILRRIDTDNIREVILATNHTVEGDTTALYLSKLMGEKNVRVTRLAFGLPANSDLEYADRLTVSRAFRGRTILES